MRQLGWLMVPLALWSLAPSALCADLAVLSPVERGKLSHGEAYAGSDVTSFWYYSYVGTIFAPFTNYEDSGFRVHLSAEAGRYFYSSEDSINSRIYVTSTDAAILAGYAFESDNYSIHFYAGPNVIAHALSSPDPENPVQGTRLGAKVQALWEVNPTARTLVAGLAEYSTAFNTYSTLARFGYSVTSNNSIFIGPEANVLGDDSYTQWRIGGFLRGPSIGNSKFSFSVGYVNDKRSGDGLYGTLEVNVPF